MGVNVEWREWIRRGIEAFVQGWYSEAIAAFQRGSETNPGSPVPKLYLAVAGLQRYIPGAESDENEDFVRRAETELRGALALDPRSWIAAVMLGQAALGEGRWSEARAW